MKVLGGLVFASAPFTIDHLICNERLLPFVASAVPLHSGDNRSRHSPIMVKLKMGELPAKVKNEADMIKRPGCYNASVADLKLSKTT